MATAKKLPSGSWRVRTCTDGKRRSYTAPTKKEAERLAAIGEEEEKERANKSMTLEEAMRGYIETCKAQGYSPSTIREYTARSKNSYSDIIKYRLERITPQDVQSVLDSRINQGKGVKTVRNDWFLLRAVLGSYAPSLNLNRVRIAKKAKRAKLVFRERWASDILRASRETWGADDFYIYCLLTIFAGLRPSESFALRWDDISASPLVSIEGEKSGVLSISAAEVRGIDGYARKAPKTAAGTRILSVPWALIEEIQTVKKRASGRILEQKPSIINWRWSQIKKKLDLPENMRFYDLRHFYATAIVASGASEEELAARMGHTTSAFSHSVYVELFEHRQAQINTALFAASESALNASKTPFSEENGHKNGHEEIIL